MKRFVELVLSNSTETRKEVVVVKGTTIKDIQKNAKYYTQRCAFFSSYTLNSISIMDADQAQKWMLDTIFEKTLSEESVDSNLSGSLSVADELLDSYDECYC